MKDPVSGDFAALFAGRSLRKILCLLQLAEPCGSIARLERQHDIEWLQVDARLAARKLLATRDVTGKRARALRLYMGIDGGKWLTYEEVGQRLGISKQAVRQLLKPSKTLLEQLLGDRIPWKPVSSREEVDPQGILGKRS